MDKNTSTETEPDGEVSEVEGPFGFGAAVKLVDGCLHTPDNDGWTKDNDTCISDPSNCEDGISLSIFEKVEFDSAITDHGERFTSNKKYIISTGGELGVPGVAIYHNGYNLVAMVSTGEQLWNVSVPGLLRNNTWNNIAIRWKPPNLDDTANIEAKDRGGLELLVNLVTVGQAIAPTKTSTQTGPPLSPPELMIGCHRTQGDKNYRNFGTGEYDEAAAWTYSLPKNKTLMFLGGYDESSSGMTSDDFEEILKQIDVTDPKQAKAVVNQLMKMTADEPKAATDEVEPEQSASQAASSSSSKASSSGGSSSSGQSQQPTAEEKVAKKEAQSVKKMETLARLIDMMTTEVKQDVTEEEIQSFFGLMGPMSNLLNPAKKDTWGKIQDAPEKSGAAGIVTKWEKWVMGNLDSLLLDKQMNQSMDLVTISPSMVMETEKILLDELRDKYNHTFQTPNYSAWGSLTEDWNQPKDTVEVPLNIFQDCGNEYINLMTICYNTYAEIAPMRVNPIYIGNGNGLAAKMDSRVCSVEVKASSGSGVPTRCRVNESLLQENPVKSYFQHGNHVQAQYKYPQRSLMEFQLEDEPKYLVKVRHCVYWNPNISDYGSWDAKKCRVVDSGPDFTKCSCSVMGTMGIIAEHFVEESIPAEALWLQIIRYTGYTLSIICLVVFICTIALSKHLKEDFHIMRMHMAVTMLLGMVAMILTDVDMLRDENIACIALSSCMHYFFTATAAWLAMESYAAFKAVTQGIISGKLLAYMPIAYGLPLISLGVSYVLASYSYGTDPRCMVSLDAGAKWMMFGPLIFLSGVGFLLASIVACNLNTPAMRRDNIVTELSPVCQGLTLLMFYFTITWCVGIPAYFNFNLAVSFYPLFQVLHCFMGVLVLLFLGLYSPRFRFVIKGQAAKRSKWLRLYAMGHKVDPEKLDDVPILAHTQDTPKHSPETPHKRVFVA